jgi:hypothetical protein
MPACIIFLMKAIDVFGVLAYWRRHRPLIEVINIIEGKNPLTPGESPWGFPIFRPTTGPSTGPASNGTPRGIPRGSSHPDFTGVVVGPPKKPNE